MKTVQKKMKLTNIRTGTVSEGIDFATLLIKIYCRFEISELKIDLCVTNVR